MTSSQESSPRRPDAVPYAAIESLAGAFHPHAIELQDFAYYTLIVDVRSQAEYEEDHIPGAVRLEPPVVDAALPQTGAGDRHDDGPPRTTASAQEEHLSGELPAELAALVAPVKLDQAILVYCGQGGRVSQPLAQALRWRGWTVDVLAGGWINYRRWVKAGLEMLPRLLSLRVVAGSLGSEVGHVLRALREEGQQVLDVEGLAEWRHGPLNRPSGVQPAQAWFESQLLRAIREFDPRAPVWAGELGQRAGNLLLPGALRDALAIAPALALRVDLQERVRQWRMDEPMLAGEAAVVVEAVDTATSLLDARAMARWQELARRGLTDALLAKLLSEHVDPAYDEDVAQRAPARHELGALSIDSFTPNALAAAVRAWVSTTSTVSAAG